MKFCSCKGNCGCTTCACGAYALFFDILGNHNRIRILNTLREEPKTVTEIIDTTGLEQTCVSHCLKKLEEGKFVTATRNGKYRTYQLNKNTIEPILKLVDKHVHA